MESKKINQLATELSPDLSDLTIIGDPTTGISRKITLSQMASLFTGTVEEYANLAAFPLVGVTDTIYIALNTNVIYRWSGSAYVELSPNIINSLVFNDANGFDGTINLVGSVATLTITTALTLGSLPFIGASGALIQDNANLFYDDTNNRLGIGTNAPTTPLDVFGSGIITRINGTSTNNGFLGFSNAGTNKWSVGNVQSDHRFRIFSEANSNELISVLQTGEFGIGIANPTTKLHIDGGASALIANLDANVSVAKSLSFRSDNSNRINLEVSGSESGSNVGADFFIRRFDDAGVLIDTPFTIKRSSGDAGIGTTSISNPAGIARVLNISNASNSGLVLTQGANNYSLAVVSNIFRIYKESVEKFSIDENGVLSAISATFSSTATASAFIPSGATVPTNGMYLSAANTLAFATNSAVRLTITTGSATLSGQMNASSFSPTSATVPTSGMYSSFANVINFATAGIMRLQIGSGGAVTATFGMQAQSFVPTNSTVASNGMYLSATNQLGFSTNSINRLNISTSAATFTVPLSGTSATFSGNVGIGSPPTQAAIFDLFGGDQAGLLTYSGFGNRGGSDLLINSYRLPSGSLFQRVSDIVSLGDDVNGRESIFRFITTNTSNSTATRLTISGSGITASVLSTFAGGATVNDVFKIYSLTTSAGVVLQGYTGGLRIAVNGSGESGGSRGDLLAAAADFSGAVTTGAPSGGTAKPFKIGNVATVTPTSQNRTIEIEIDGTTYYLTAKTTNN